VLKDGICSLVTHKQERVKGKLWTSASIWTKSFRQTYGYYEARIRIADATGLNNAFWLHTDRAETDPSKSFEIDIAEVHYPNYLQTSLWDRTKKTNQLERKQNFFDVPLSGEFHTYGLEWNEQWIIYYLDGKEVWTIRNRVANSPVHVLLSTMVRTWAGKVTDALDNTSMQVDWVRVYQKNP
jgi:beta-glucanase (GH16 family)